MPGIFFCLMPPPPFPLYLLHMTACSQLIHSLVTVRMDYCNSLLYGIPDSTLFRLQKVFNTAAGILKKIPQFSHITDILKDLHWLPIRQRITFKILLLTYQAYHNTAPDYLCELITPYCSARNLRSNDIPLEIGIITKSQIY